MKAVFVGDRDSDPQTDTNLTLGVPVMSLRELSNGGTCKTQEASYLLPICFGVHSSRGTNSREYHNNMDLSTQQNWGETFPGWGTQTDGFLQVPITNSFIHGCFC